MPGLRQDDHIALDVVRRSAAAGMPTSSRNRWPGVLRASFGKQLRRRCQGLGTSWLSPVFGMCAEYAQRFGARQMREFRCGYRFLLEQFAFPR